MGEGSAGCRDGRMCSTMNHRHGRTCRRSAARLAKPHEALRPFFCMSRQPSCPTAQNSSPTPPLHSPFFPARFVSLFSTAWGGFDPALDPRLTIRPQSKSSSRLGVPMSLHTNDGWHTELKDVRAPFKATTHGSRVTVKSLTCSQVEAE